MNILVIQLKRLGDTLLVTPILPLLRKQFPKARITLVTDSLSGSLAPLMPIDDCIIPEKEGLTALWEIKSNPYDICLDFSGTDRSAWITFLSGAKRRLTYSRFRKKPFRRWIYTDWSEASVRNRHTVDYHADLLKLLGISDRPGPIALSIPRDVDARVKAKLQSITSNFVVIHPCSARREKFWDAKKWAVVIKHLKEQWGLTSLITGTETKSEKEHVKEIIRLAGTGEDWTGKLALPELVGTLKHATLFCGVDSAPLHLCDAVNTSCVGLFGPTNPYHWQPRFAPSRILRAGYEGHEFTPNQKGGEMHLLTSEQVVEKIDDLMIATKSCRIPTRRYFNE